MKIGIVGLGLIGGSIFKTLKALNNHKYEIVGVSSSVKLKNVSKDYEILKTALYEFPILDIEINIPSWVHSLANNHPIKEEYLTKLRESMDGISKLKDAENIINYYKDS